MCILDEKIARIQELTHKNLHKTNAHQLTCKLWNLTCSLTCEEKNHKSNDTLEIEMTCTTKHVTLRWHFRRKYRSQRYSGDELCSQWPPTIDSRTKPTDAIIPTLQTEYEVRTTNHNSSIE